ncbi:MAG: 30S ribosome-binding factor RbfA [Chitinophagales bacterium]|nr:30S ribosome-binding factor RbfA [Chitinophagales bacterium]MCO5280533.1 30S ribosome-binding factor RbfA [Chitinophagales bacterium]OJV26767.1 MAG: ribosome-binding factor A [Bacteroidetes bacterium 37-13]HRN94681.1 30S ribosome-binding factor RbfA [Chitinophagales bacterium]HRP40070.1 30S ribosome-binding factor RbfA [Chitinophagales bacterium]
MDSRRQQKIGMLMKEEFSSLLNKDYKVLFGKGLISVTNVKVTSDLSIARFYLSIFNVEDKEETLKRFRELTAEFRGKLGGKLRHQLRKIPEFEFYIDETLDYVFHMEQVLKDLKKE